MDVQTAKKLKLIESLIARLSLSEDPNAKRKIFNLLMHIGMNYSEKGEFAQAIDVFKRAIDAHPDDPDAQCLLAMTLYRSGKVSEGIKILQTTLNLCPDHTNSLENLAKVRFRQKNFEEAERLCRRAIEISKVSDIAVDLMRQLLYQKGDMVGLAELQKQNPNGADNIEEVYTCKQFCCDWHDYDSRMKNLSDLIDRSLSDNVTPPIKVLQAAQYFFPLSLQQQLAIATDFAQKSKSTAEPIKHRSIGKGNRLRVGYIYTGSTGFPLDSELEGAESRHNPARVEIFRYRLSNIEAVKSATGEMTVRKSDQRRQQWNDHMVNLSTFGDDFNAAANRIASDGIQILVNLDSVLLDWQKLNAILALRPAPIQAVYRNTLGTTGASYVDYFITDKVASPLRFAYGYSEKFAYLPNGMSGASEDQLQVKQREKVKKCSLRRRYGLPQLPFVFGVKSEPWRIDPDIFECWCEILRRVPGSVVWMMEVCSDEAKSNLKKEAKRHRVNPSRLVFAPVSILKPIRLDYLVDVVLDTPMCNAISQIRLISAAIPIVTLPMENFTSRLTASVLTSSGCEELIVTSKREYVEKAVKLGNEPELLAAMKDRMWKNLPNSNLFKSDQYYDDLENLYEKMWKRQEMGEKPDHIE